jgi:hypothetical protein
MVNYQTAIPSGTIPAQLKKLCRNFDWRKKLKRMFEFPLYKLPWKYYETYIE